MMVYQGEWLGMTGSDLETRFAEIWEPTIRGFEGRGSLGVPWHAMAMASVTLVSGILWDSLGPPTLLRNCPRSQEHSGPRPRFGG